MTVFAVRLRDAERVSEPEPGKTKDSRGEREKERRTLQQDRGFLASSDKRPPVFSPLTHGCSELLVA